MDNEQVQTEVVDQNHDVVEQNVDQPDVSAKEPAGGDEPKSMLDAVSGALTKESQAEEKSDDNRAYRD